MSTPSKKLFKPEGTSSTPKVDSASQTDSFASPSSPSKKADTYASVNKNRAGHMQFPQQPKPILRASQGQLTAHLQKRFSSYETIPTKTSAPYLDVAPRSAKHSGGTHQMLGALLGKAPNIAAIQSNLSRADQEAGYMEVQRKPHDLPPGYLSVLNKQDKRAYMTVNTQGSNRPDYLKIGTQDGGYITAGPSPGRQQSSIYTSIGGSPGEQKIPKSDYMQMQKPFYTIPDKPDYVDVGKASESKIAEKDDPIYAEANDFIRGLDDRPKKPKPNSVEGDSHYMNMDLSSRSKTNPHQSDSPAKGVDANPPSSRKVDSVSPAPAESSTPRPRMRG